MLFQKGSVVKVVVGPEGCSLVLGGLHATYFIFAGLFILFFYLLVKWSCFVHLAAQNAVCAAVLNILPLY